MGASFGSEGIVPFGGSQLVLPPGEIHFAVKTMVVLNGTIYPEGFIHVILHIVELSQWKLLDQIAPVFTLVVGDTDASVMGCQDIVGVIGIDPHAVLIRMDLSAMGSKVAPPSVETLIQSPRV